ncbi:MAG: site-2 protease family protein [Archaeoglobaceae archaeon]
MIEDYFYVYASEKLNDGVRYYVIPKRSHADIEAFLMQLSSEYDVSLRKSYGELLLEIRRSKQNYVPNIILFIATLATTTLFGSMFYEGFNILGGLAFSGAIFFVLGSHELAHYLTARKWGMRTSLPYFIPFPTIIGTLGAVIKYKGAIPNRRALFDVGISGPLAGCLASVIVIFIGLQFPYEARNGERILIGTPLLFDLLVQLAGFSGEFIHPIAFAGWVGLFVTFFNLLPVGQLDGGHVVRAMIGEKSEIVSKATPFVLILLSIFFGEIWLFWGLILMLFAMQKHPKPLEDHRIDKKRFALGIFGYLIFLLCFIPQPFKL